MALLPAIIVALTALILTPGYLFYFDITPKVVAVLAGTGAWLAWSVCAQRGMAIPRGRLPRAFALLLALNVASLAISTAVSSRPGLSLFGTNWRRYGSILQAAVCLFAWLAVSACAGHPGRVKTVLRGVAGAGGLSAAYGIAQYFGWDPLLPAAAYHAGEGVFTIVRPPGTLGYASYFATWLLFVIFLSLALRELEAAPIWRNTATGVALIATAAMLLTGTRAAIAGLAVGGAVWVLVRRPRIPRRAMALAGVAVLLGAGFYFSPPGRQLRARVHWIRDDPWGGARLKLWRDSVRMASHRLAAGYGPEVFTGEFPRFESAELARAYPNFAHESPHNIFLDALASQGLPGMLVLLGLCAAGLGAAVRGKHPLLAAAIAAGIVSQQFTAFTLPTAVIFFTTLGLAISGKMPPGAAVRPRIALKAAAIVTAAALLYFSLRFTVSDHALALAQRGLNRGDIGYAAAQYRNYERRRLPGGSADLWYSRAVLAAAPPTSPPNTRLAALLESEKSALRATQTAEDPFNAWYNLAIIDAAREDRTAVERSLRRAIAAHPTWFKPHWTLAQLLHLEGRLQEARGEAQRAADLDGGKDTPVMQTLDALRNPPALVPAPTFQK